jgi:hypothetical protein
MTTLPDNAGPQQALADAVSTLVATHGVQALVSALFTLCRWRAHHLRSRGERQQADAWERAGTTLAWDAQTTLRGLDGPCAGGAGPRPRNPTEEHPR